MKAWQILNGTEATPGQNMSLFFKKVIDYLFKSRETVGEAAHWWVHCPNASSSQGWARAEPES